MRILPYLDFLGKKMRCNVQTLACSVIFSWLAVLVYIMTMNDSGQGETSADTVSN